MGLGGGNHRNRRCRWARGGREDAELVGRRPLRGNLERKYSAIEEDIGPTGKKKPKNATHPGICGFLALRKG